MEREFYVLRRKLGSYVNHKLYEVWPDTVQTVSTPLPKRLLAEFRTRLDLLHYGLANYEGLCLGPRLADGSRVIVMVSDSQSRYRGVLKDWFKTIVAR